MKITYERGLLINALQGFYLCHCITSDFIAMTDTTEDIFRAFNMREKLLHIHGNGVVGEAFLVDNVFNLITIDMFSDEETEDELYKALEEALFDMRYQMRENMITNLALSQADFFPDISWENAKAIIEHVFEDMDVNILVLS